jgi:putative transcriptional regulator
MTIHHHLTPALLMAYAAGTLPEPLGLVIASHLSLCTLCRAEAAAFEMLGGAVLDQSEAPPLPENAIEASIARITALPRLPPAPPKPRDATLPGPLIDAVGGGLSAVKWRPIGMGAKQAILPLGDKSASVRLLSIPGGTALPDHGHSGLELTLVLQGAYHDGARCFARGDIEIADTDVNHTPVAAPGALCICLSATIGSLKFSGLLPRLVQPFLKI